jgi:hypothetical protein
VKQPEPEKVEFQKVPVDRNGKWTTQTVRSAASILAMFESILSALLPPEFRGQVEELKLNNLRELSRSLEAIANGFYEVPAENCPRLVQDGYNRSRTVFFACCEQCARDLKLWIAYLPERVIFQKGKKWCAVAWGQVVSPKPFDTLDEAINCLKALATEADMWQWLELLQEPAAEV